MGRRGVSCFKTIMKGWGRDCDYETWIENRFASCPEGYIIDYQAQGRITVANGLKPYKRYIQGVPPTDKRIHLRSKGPTLLL